jgi:hypothetical protein
MNNEMTIEEICAEAVLHAGLARNSSHRRKFPEKPSNPPARTPKSAASPSPEGRAALLSFSDMLGTVTDHPA